MTVEWDDVPEECVKEWRDIFDDNRDGINLSASCPVCGESELHQYYHINKLEGINSSGRVYKGRGGYWTWCSGCRHFEHYSALIPLWWKCDFMVEESRLCATPGEIEEERLKFEGII